MMTARALKKVIFEILTRENLAEGIGRIGQLPPRQAVSPLFSLFYHGDEKIRWGAVAAMGEVVSGMAKTEMEAARVVMRRMMWNLNDESGGIGWGSPEAMGEVMARSKRICREFAAICAPISILPEITWSMKSCSGGCYGGSAGWPKAGLWQRKAPRRIFFRFFRLRIRIIGGLPPGRWAISAASFVSRCTSWRMTTAVSYTHLTLPTN